MTPMLSLLVLVPLLGAGLVALMPSREPGVAKALTLAVAAVELGLGWRVLSAFDFAVAGPQLHERVAWIEPLGPALQLALDGASLWPIALTIVAVLLALLGGWDHVRELGRELGVPLLLFEAGAVGFFLARDVGAMFAGWELVAFAGWALTLPLAEPAERRWADRWLIGTQLGAGLWAAAVVLAGVAHYNANPGQWSLDLADLSQVMLPAAQQQLAFAGVAIGVLGMIPLFPAHAWAPGLARARNPIAAAIVCVVPIELGVQLLARVGIGLFPLGALDLAPAGAGLALVGIAHAALAVRAERSLGRIAGYGVSALACVQVIAVLGMHADGLMGAVQLGIARGLGALALVLVAATIVRSRGTDLLEGPGGRAVGCASIWALAAPALAGFAGLIAIAAASLDAAAVGLPDAGPVTLAAVVGVVLMFALMLARIGGALGSRRAAPAPARESITLALIVVLALAAGAFPGWLWGHGTFTAREWAAQAREHVCVGEAARALTRAERYDALAVDCEDER